ncbi:MAG: hypothetical protein HYV63_14125 [Candidatus Schekmanbacteria bacterium]|nr:hypothetical protein [Candidatus Schekmanbacteria bacterium]
MNQTILVLGGGAGAVVTAVELRKTLAKNHRIVLVDREERHVFAPSLLWLMTGDRTAEKISRPLDRLARRGIEVERGEITSIDPVSRRVEVNGRVLEGSFLVVSLGAERVYAIGDVTGIPLKAGKPLPKAGVFAHRQASVVARNITQAITGRGETTSFDGHGECFVEVGDGRAGFGSGTFYAEPAPVVRMHRPGLRWHWGKVLFEKYWLRRWF